MGKVEFQKGNEFLIIGDKTGIVKDKFTDILIDDKKVKKAQQGDVITFKLDQKVREEDDFYLWNNA